MAKTKNVAKQALLSSNYWVINKIIVRKFGIEAAFLLSVFAEAENMMADPDGWFYQTIEKTEEITTLTRWKQEQAIKKLIAENLLEQVAKGMPRKRYYRINYEVLTNLFASDLQTGLRVAYKQECEPLTISKESSYKENNINDDIEVFFEKCWSLYPKKKGKGSISKSKKKELFKLGERLVEAINGYKKEIKQKNTEEQFILNGSTFFNTRYLDYLVEEKKPKQKLNPEDYFVYMGEA